MASLAWKNEHDEDKHTLRNSLTLGQKETLHSFFELVGWFSHQGKQILGFNSHSYSLWIFFLFVFFVNQSFNESGRTTRQIQRVEGGNSVLRLEMTLFSILLSPANPVDTQSCVGLGPYFKGNPLNIAWISLSVHFYMLEPPNEENRQHHFSRWTKLNSPWKFGGWSFKAAVSSIKTAHSSTSGFFHYSTTHSKGLVWTYAYFRLK